jgi:hypothetical protein
MPDGWMSAMLDGDFERAWRISDAVLDLRRGRSCAHLPYHLRWLWDGTPLAGRRVLLRCYHGLGDTLQFIRFMPRVANCARSVAVMAQPELLELLRSIGDHARFLPLKATPPSCDLEIESMELPHALRLAPEDLPGPVPYLSVPRPMIAAAAGRLPPRRRLRLGVVWAAGGWRPERSVPLAALAPLADLPVELVSLQQGEPGAGCARWFAARPNEGRSIMETAALLHHLDLVVTVDTMMAHLAGALGRPVWVLLHHDADWRWMRHRADTLWYPTMRLFRQARPGDWASLIAQLAAALSLLARRSGQERPALPYRSEGEAHPKRSRAMAEHKTTEAHVTTDHDEIRRWAEERGGKPAAVKATHRKGDAGILRIIFPKSQFADDDSLEEISWDDFFDKFDEAELALIYQERTAGGQPSLFNKLIGRDTAEAREHGEAKASRHHGRSR